MEVLLQIRLALGSLSIKGETCQMEN